MGLPYPGGPMIDKYALKGNPQAFNFQKANLKGLDFSFSGLKTSFLYFLQDRVKENSQFIHQHMADLSASIQKAIIDSLMIKLRKAVQETGIHDIAVAGGVSANNGLRRAVHEFAQQQNCNVYIPELSYATDNAAMIAVTGYYKYLKDEFSDQDIIPAARYTQL